MPGNGGGNLVVGGGDVSTLERPSLMGVVPTQFMGPGGGGGGGSGGGPASSSPSSPPPFNTAPGAGGGMGLGGMYPQHQPPIMSQPFLHPMSPFHAPSNIQFPHPHRPPCCGDPGANNLYLQMDMQQHPPPLGFRPGDFSLSPHPPHSHPHPGLMAGPHPPDFPMGGLPGMAGPPPPFPPPFFGPRNPAGVVVLQQPHPQAHGGGVVPGGEPPGEGRSGSPLMPPSVRRGDAPSPTAAAAAGGGQSNRGGGRHFPAHRGGPAPSVGEVQDPPPEPDRHHRSHHRRIENQPVKSRGGGGGVDRRGNRGGSTSGQGSAELAGADRTTSTSSSGGSHAMGPAASQRRGQQQSMRENHQTPFADSSGADVIPSPVPPQSPSPLADGRRDGLGCPPPGGELEVVGGGILSSSPPPCVPPSFHSLPGMEAGNGAVLLVPAEISLPPPTGPRGTALPLGQPLAGGPGVPPPFFPGGGGILPVPHQPGMGDPEAWRLTCSTPAGGSMGLLENAGGPLPTLGPPSAGYPPVAHPHSQPGQQQQQPCRQRMETSSGSSSSVEAPQQRRPRKKMTNMSMAEATRRRSISSRLEGDDLQGGGEAGSSVLHSVSPVAGVQRDLIGNEVVPADMAVLPPTPHLPAMPAGGEGMRVDVEKTSGGSASPGRAEAPSAPSPPAVLCSSGEESVETDTRDELVRPAGAETLGDSGEEQAVGRPVVETNEEAKRQKGEEREEWRRGSREDEGYKEIDQTSVSGLISGRQTSMAQAGDDKREQAVVAETGDEERDFAEPLQTKDSSCSHFRDPEIRDDVASSKSAHVPSSGEDGPSSQKVSVGKGSSAAFVDANGRSEGEGEAEGELRRSADLPQIADSVKKDESLSGGDASGVEKAKKDDSPAVDGPSCVGTHASAESIPTSADEKKGERPGQEEREVRLSEAANGEGREGEPAPKQGALESGSKDFIKEGRRDLAAEEDSPAATSSVIAGPPHGMPASAVPAAASPSSVPAAGAEGEEGRRALHQAVPEAERDHRLPEDERGPTSSCCVADTEKKEDGEREKPEKVEVVLGDMSDRAGVILDASTSSPTNKEDEYASPHCGYSFSSMPSLTNNNEASAEGRGIETCGEAPDVPASLLPHPAPPSSADQRRKVSLPSDNCTSPSSSSSSSASAPHAVSSPRDENLPPSAGGALGSSSRSDVKSGPLSAAFSSFESCCSDFSRGDSLNPAAAAAAATAPVEGPPELQASSERGASSVPKEEVFASDSTSPSSSSSASSSSSVLQRGGGMLLPRGPAAAVGRAGGGSAGTGLVGASPASSSSSLHSRQGGGSKEKPKSESPLVASNSPLLHFCPSQSPSTTTTTTALGGGALVDSNLPPPPPRSASPFLSDMKRPSSSSSSSTSGSDIFDRRCLVSFFLGLCKDKKRFLSPLPHLGTFRCVDPSEAQQSGGTPTKRGGAGGSGGAKDWGGGSSGTSSSGGGGSGKTKNAGSLKKSSQSSGSGGGGVGAMMLGGPGSSSSGSSSSVGSNSVVGGGSSGGGGVLGRGGFVGKTIGGGFGGNGLSGSSKTGTGGGGGAGGRGSRGGSGSDWLDSPMERRPSEGGTGGGDSFERHLTGGAAAGGSGGGTGGGWRETSGGWREVGTFILFIGYEKVFSRTHAGSHEETEVTQRTMEAMKGVYILGLHLRLLHTRDVGLDVE